MADCSYSFDPADDPGATLEAMWNCPHEAHPDSSYCLFHMSREERDSHGITPGDVVDRIKENLRTGDPYLNEYIGADVPKLRLSHSDIDGATNRRLNFQYATVDLLDLTAAAMHQGIDVSHATLGSVVVEDTEMDGDFVADAAEVTGDLTAEEAVFRGNFEFEDATFGGRVAILETKFEDEARFGGATFGGSVSFQACRFSGISHDLDDKADFGKTTFEGEVEFTDAIFECSDFSGARFEDRAVFDHTSFRGDVLFSSAEFRRVAKFREARFREDAAFDGASFGGVADFLGAEFQGGSRVADDDVTFEDVDFHDVATFESVEFRYANFSEAVFEAVAGFEAATFVDDADFVEVTFHEEADFDESRFKADADFERSEFLDTAVFRGAEFEGRSRHLKDNVRFQGVTFHRNAEFDSAEFTTASFEETKFGDAIDFRNSVFHERADFEVHPMEETSTYVNFTDAEIYGGTIEEATGDLVPYDLTEATLGDVDIEGKTGVHQLLDYFRFCRTEFDGFDFSDHHDYFERNDWSLHSFEAGDVDLDPAKPMSEQNVEDTYDKAQSSAVDIGDKRAASEFEIKRNRYNRRKNRQLLSDETAALGAAARARKIVSVWVNWFMDLTCGYGNRVPRIFFWTFFNPLLYAFVYAFVGGEFAHPEGMPVTIADAASAPEAVKNAIYFSYVTFSTIGYGDISPISWYAQVLAFSQGLLNAVLFALLIYTLSKQTDY